MATCKLNEPEDKHEDEDHDDRRIHFIKRNQEQHSRPTERNQGQQSRPTERNQGQQSRPTERNQEQHSRPTERNQGQQSRPTERNQEQQSRPTERNQGQQSRPTERNQGQQSRPTERNQEQHSRPTERNQEHTSRPIESNLAFLDSYAASARTESRHSLYAQVAPDRLSNNGSGMAQLGYCRNQNLRSLTVTKAFQEATFDVNPDMARLKQPINSAIFVDNIKDLLSQMSVEVSTPTARGTGSLMASFTWARFKQYLALSHIKTGSQPASAPLIVKTRKDIITTEQDASNAIVKFTCHTDTHSYSTQAQKCKKQCTETEDSTFLKCYDVPMPICQQLRRIARCVCELIRSILRYSASLNTFFVVGHRGSDQKIVCEDQHRGKTPTHESTSLDEDADRFFSSNSGRKLDSNNWMEVKDNIFTGDRSPLLIHFGPGIETCINSILQSL